MDNYTRNKLLSRVEKPGFYTGAEPGSVHKNKAEVDIRFLFAFADTYDIGMSHLGLRILYSLINDRQDAWCERVFAPCADMEKLLREGGYPLFALESGDPLSAFDFIGFTLQYEMSYSNLVNMLNMGGVTLRSAERGEDEPLVVAGGPCAYNCEPLADFLDLVMMGEGEEQMNEVLDLWKECKASGLSKDEYLYRAATEIGGVYVPKFYDVTYKEDGTVCSVKPNRDGVPATVRKRIIEDFDKCYYPTTHIVPEQGIVFDRVMMEIMRGCGHGCRFCQAGFIYRPVRERKPATVLACAKETLAATGYEELSLSSLSTGDYTGIVEVATDLIHEYADKHVNISLPSLRIDSFSEEYAAELAKARKAGLTLAPEAGTQRMRDVINKGVTEQNLYDSVTEAFSLGWDRVKLYFMLGLPTETDEDVKGIATLAKNVKKCFLDIPKEKRSKRFACVVSTAFFVPKPFTPFQWEPQIPLEEYKRRHELLNSELRGARDITYNWHGDELSCLEAVFARGDRRLADVIELAVKKGARMDGWAEQFRYDLWVEAFNECGIDPEFYWGRKREYDEVLPWDHIDVGVTKAHLIREAEKAKRGEVTPDCATKCSGCGVSNCWKGVCGK